MSSLEYVLSPELRASVSPWSQTRALPSLPTCFLTLSISARSFWIILLISFSVLFRSSPCLPAVVCSCPSCVQERVTLSESQQGPYRSPNSTLHVTGKKTKTQTCDLCKVTQLEEPGALLPASGDLSSSTIAVYVGRHAAPSPVLYLIRRHNYLRRKL